MCCQGHQVRGVSHSVGLVRTDQFQTAGGAVALNQSHCTEHTGRVTSLLHHETRGMLLYNYLTARAETTATTTAPIAVTILYYHSYLTATTIITNEQIIMHI